ncbi:transposase [Streptomyces sp. NBC_00576]|nr:hypothetical protein [Streptomyces sp. NBC_00576]WUB72509.1 transposase [Streptomyces sp. NBC_00576]
MSGTAPSERTGSAETAGGYGPLEALARNKVNVKNVLTAWPDMLRVARSLGGLPRPSTGTGWRTSSAHSAWS